MLIIITRKYKVLIIRRHGWRAQPATADCKFTDWIIKTLSFVSQLRLLLGEHDGSPLGIDDRGGGGGGGIPASPL